jgi:hypothetical protein
MRLAARKTALALALACLSLAPLAPALAGPADYLFSPIVEKGEKEIELKAGTAKNRDGTRESEWRLSIGYGFTDWWFSEIGTNWHKVPGESHDFDAWEWENRFHLLKAEKYPLDVGFLLEIERPRDRSEGYEYRWGPLLQADLSPKVTANLNLLIEKRIRAVARERAELGYQWQLRYHWREEFEFGVQGFGDVGRWDHWESSSQQSHILGPALFGEVKVFGEHEIKYNAGVLFGVTHGSPRNTLRLQAEYEF